MVNKIRVSDYIIKFLSFSGINHVFQVPGGGAMYLNDAVTRSDISPIFCHHEQACAMSAVAYNKSSNKIPLVITTSGCGSTNAITGCLDAWQDGNSVIFLSGQCNLNDIPKNGIRKRGLQAVDIIEIVKSITKYSVTVTDPLQIKNILRRALFECSTGYKGPVWIDVPLDIQNSYINEYELYDDEKCIEPEYPFVLDSFENELKTCKRPLILVGGAINTLGLQNKFRKFIEYYNIPTVSTFLGTDIIDSNHELNIGRAGLKGTRAGNFSISNCDLLIVIGASLNLGTTGFLKDSFAKNARKVVIDINSNYANESDIKIDKLITTDLTVFFNQYPTCQFEFKDWIKTCNKWKRKWDIFDRPDIHELNMYSFTKALSEKVNMQEYITVTDAGSANYLMCQAMQNTKLVVPASQGEMGFCLPGVVGAYIANPTKKIIGVTGDGSFQFNIQELQTIIQNKIPAKIVIFNNGGYLSIKNTQEKFFDNRYSGINSTTGISFPEIDSVVTAYNLCYILIDSVQDLNKKIDQFLNYPGPIVCEVICPTNEQIYPTVAAKEDQNGRLVAQPIENMYPFLSKEEFESEMIIKSSKN